jgi:hypothetical protein
MMLSLTLSSHAQAPGSPQCLRTVAWTDLFANSMMRSITLPRERVLGPLLGARGRFLAQLDPSWLRLGRILSCLSLLFDHPGQRCGFLAPFLVDLGRTWAHPEGPRPLRPLVLWGQMQVRCSRPSWAYVGPI